MRFGAWRDGVGTPPVDAGRFSGRDPASALVTPEQATAKKAAHVKTSAANAHASSRLRGREGKGENGQRAAKRRDGATLACS
jgi:hypothetical protein